MAPQGSSLDKMLDEAPEEQVTELGHTKDEMIEMLTKLWGNTHASASTTQQNKEGSPTVSKSEQKKLHEVRQAVHKEVKHIEWVIAQEEYWNSSARANEEANLAENMHKISDFSREILRISRNCPLRLTEEERRIGTILESSLAISDYTYNVDCLGRGNRMHTITRELEEICSMISGMVVSHSFERGQSFGERKLSENLNVYRKIFEIGRRTKILNPKLLRNTYGKLMWILMDSEKYSLGKEAIQTVFGLLMARERDDCEAFLRDPLLEIAIKEIVVEGKSAEEIKAQAEKKKSAFEQMKKKYGRAPDQPDYSVCELLTQWASQDKADAEGGKFCDPRQGEMMTPTEVERILNSFSDYFSAQHSYRDPVVAVIDLLEDLFPETEKGVKVPCLQDLSIRSRQGGSCLTHGHATQFCFVRQSLGLWAECMKQMVYLWHYAEQDLINQRYNLRDTGQGLNRVQSAPLVSGCMHKILGSVQENERANGRRWVGLSVVHLGDRDVPNTLFFIDKYSQIPRILAPIAMVMEKLPKLYELRADVKKYVDDYAAGLVGGADKLKMVGVSPVDVCRRAILRDYFRHGFDGSGDDGGSCVDGRLTSCWNWCSQVEKKSYFPLMLFCGFTGFDG